MQKDMVPSGQKRFIAEKSQKEIVQKGAERESYGVEQIKKPFQIRLGSGPFRSASRRPARDGPTARCFFHSERMIT